MHSRRNQVAAESMYADANDIQRHDAPIVSLIQEFHDSEAEFLQ
jgi:hypothetical protein